MIKIKNIIKVYIKPGEKEPEYAYIYEDEKGTYYLTAEKDENSTK